MSTSSQPLRVAPPSKTTKIVNRSTIKKCATQTLSKLLIRSFALANLTPLIVDWSSRSAFRDSLSVILWLCSPSTVAGSGLFIWLIFSRILNRSRYSLPAGYCMFRISCIRGIALRLLRTLFWILCWCNTAAKIIFNLFLKCRSTGDSARGNRRLCIIALCSIRCNCSSFEF